MESTVPVTVGSYNCDIVFPLLPKTHSMSYGVAITATVLWYYIGTAFYFSAGRGGSWGVTGALLVFYFAIFAFQFILFMFQGMYAKCTITWVGILLSAFIGIAVGLIAFGIVAGTDPSNLPYVGEIEKFTNVILAGGLGKSPPPSVVKDSSSSKPDDVQQSHKMDDKDEFVCDLYKNGQLITSTISE